MKVAKEVILDMETAEAIAFFKWLLELVKFQEVVVSDNGAKIFGKYTNGDSVEIYCLNPEDEKAHCLITSDNNTIVEALEEFSSKEDIMEKWSKARKELCASKEGGVYFVETKVNLPPTDYIRDYALYTFDHLDYHCKADKKSLLSATTSEKNWVSIKRPKGFKEPLTFRIESNNQKVAEAVADFFKNDSNIAQWKAELLEKKKLAEEQKLERQKASKQVSKESFQNTIQTADAGNVEELSIYIPAMGDHKSFFLYVVLPLGYSKLQSKTNCYSAISPTGHKATFKYLGGFRQPLTFSIESDSPEELEELVSLFSDPNVAEKWKDEIAARKARDAQRKAAQKQAAEAEQYEKDQRKAAKLQVDYYENLARCPKCGSTSLSGHKKGFGVGKALTGAALGSFILGPVGLLGVTAGNKGAKKLYVTCLNCGHKWKTKK